MKKSFNYKEAGVTLIALVVTIIVLLILAGITISVSLGNKGILSFAKNAGESYGQAEKDDKQAVNNYRDVLTQATTNKFSIYLDGQELKLVPMFFSSDSTLLTDTNDNVLYMLVNDNLNIYDVNDNYIIKSSDLQNTTIDNAIELKKNDKNRTIEKNIYEYGDELYLDSCWYDDYDASDYFINEIENNRPHLYINGEDIGLDGWNYNYNESEERYELKNSRGSYLYATDYNNGTLYYNKSGNPITINIKINNPNENNPSLELSGFNPGDLTDFKLVYDDGRTYDRNTKEFMYVIWNLLRGILPHNIPD